MAETDRHGSHDRKCLSDGAASHNSCGDVPVARSAPEGSCTRVALIAGPERSRLGDRQLRGLCSSRSSLAGGRCYGRGAANLAPGRADFVARARMPSDWAVTARCYRSGCACTNTRSVALPMRRQRVRSPMPGRFLFAQGRTSTRTAGPAPAWPRSRMSRGPQRGGCLPSRPLWPSDQCLLSHTPEDFAYCRPNLRQLSCKGGTSKPAGRGSPSLGRFDSFAASWREIRSEQQSAQTLPLLWIASCPITDRTGGV
jgi:hypothetical protein